MFRVRLAWGKIDGMADRLGLPYSGQPQAELWLGAHPLLPAEDPEPNVTVEQPH